MAAENKEKKSVRGILIALAVFNSLFLVLGFVLLICVVQTSLVQSLAQSDMAILEKSIPVIMNAMNIKDPKPPPGHLVADFDTAVSGLAVGSIMFGSLLIILAFVGICSVWQRIRFLVITYVILLGVVILAQILIIIFLFGGTFNTQLKSYLEKALKENYGGLDSYNMESVVWNYFMIHMKCCGMTSYLDFDQASQWDKGRLIGTSSVALRTPMACCHMVGDKVNIYRPSNPGACATSPTDAISNWKEGCWPAIERSFRSYRGAGITIGFIVILIEVVCIALAMWLILELWRAAPDGKHSMGDTHYGGHGAYPSNDLDDVSLPSFDSNRSAHDMWPEFPATTSTSGVHSATPDWYTSQRTFGRIPVNSSGRPDVFYNARINRPFGPMY